MLSSTPRPFALPTSHSSLCNSASGRSLQDEGARAAALLPHCNGMGANTYQKKRSMRPGAAGTGGPEVVWKPLDNAHALDIGMHGQRAGALDEEGTSNATGHTKHDGDHFPLT